MHGGVRGHRSERMNQDATMFLLELFKRFEDLVINLSLIALGGCLVWAVDNEQGSGVAGELDEVEGKYDDGGPSRRVGSF